MSKTPTYPFIAKSTAHLKVGQFWAVKLHLPGYFEAPNYYGCARVLQLYPSTAANANNHAELHGGHADSVCFEQFFFGHNFAHQCATSRPVQRIGKCLTKPMNSRIIELMAQRMVVWLHKRTWQIWASNQTLFRNEKKPNSKSLSLIKYLPEIF